MNNLQKQSLWFCIIGSVAAVTHFICLLLFVEYIELSPLLANPLAFLVAFIISFCGHFHFSFRQSSHSWQQAIWRWFCSSTLGFILNQLLFSIGLRYLGNNVYWWLWFCVTFFITILTYLMGKFWAFKECSNNEVCDN